MFSSNFITFSNFSTKEIPSALHELFKFFSFFDLCHIVRKFLWSFKYKVFKTGWQLSEVPGSYFKYCEIFVMGCTETLSHLFYVLANNACPIIRISSDTSIYILDDWCLVSLFHFICSLNLLRTLNEHFLHR